MYVHLLLLQIADEQGPDYSNSHYQNTDGTTVQAADRHTSTLSAYCQ
jgi:hypothetical protein